MAATDHVVCRSNWTKWFYTGVLFLVGAWAIPIGVMAGVYFALGENTFRLFSAVGLFLYLVLYLGCLGVSGYCGLRLWLSVYAGSPMARRLGGGFLIVVSGAGVCFGVVSLVLGVMDLTNEGRLMAGRTGSCHQQIKNYSSAVDLYLLDTGVYPTTAQGLNALVVLPTMAPKPTNWRGPYLAPAVIRSDPWGSAYVYRCPGIKNTKTYDIVSPGPNMILGDADDIGN
jgi:general secretion pathway protein G